MHRWRHWLGIGLMTLLLAALAACGGSGGPEAVSGEQPEAQAADQEQAGNAEETKASTAGEAQAETRTLDYLGEEYTVPSEADKIVITGSFESMEDALVLGVEPTAAITVGGEFPDMFADITRSAVSSGEKKQPDMEKILELKPDVILSTAKFPEKINQNLAKIAPTIPVSHLSTNWKANLLLLAELTGKQAEAEAMLKQYEADAAAAREQLGEQLKEQTVVAVRIRSGNIMIYSEDVFFNPTLYEDLGLPVPDQIKAAKSQEVISLEKFSEMNPDYIFVQFSASENANQPKALDELQSNPIWTSIRAVQNDNVFVNVVDPLAQGGTAWSKIHFLKAAVERLANP